MLTPRQEQILCIVVDVHIQTGQPVPSRTIAAQPGFDCGPSTVRSELAHLEEVGLLTHPHTSAGRVPTDAGRRYVVDRMLSSSRLPQPKLQLSLMRREVDDAMRCTTQALSQITNLLAVVSAPPLNIAIVRHVEVLALQPQVVAVVTITSTGAVTKMIATFDAPVDSGLVGWAGAYLNERLVGHALGSRLLHQRRLDQSLPHTELSFLRRLVPAFLQEPITDAEASIYVGGAGRLLQASERENITELNELMNLLEQRVALLSLLRTVLSAPDVYVSIGEENELPGMRSLSVVAAAYGLAQRKLGAVSVIGPVRMDYKGAITTVRAAANELSRYVEESYADA